MGLPAEVPDMPAAPTHSAKFLREEGEMSERDERERDEQEGPKPGEQGWKTWPERLKDAARRAKQRLLAGGADRPEELFTGEDREDAHRWGTCAVGEQHQAEGQVVVDVRPGSSAYRRHGAPYDVELYDAGMEFAEAVDADRLEDAQHFYGRILARVAELRREAQAAGLLAARAAENAGQQGQQGQQEPPAGQEGGR